MKNSPLVSVLCITYNQEKFIAQTIESFLKQEINFSYEIVLSDDCSTDSTLEICKRYLKLNPGSIRILETEKNIGAQKNWYKAYNACNGKYIAVCEGDDYWTDPYKLQKQFNSICFHGFINPFA